jgi:hypothetical protein
MYSLVQSSATRCPQESLPSLSAAPGSGGDPGAGKALGAGCGRALGKETEPSEGMWWFAMSHSMASLAAYCFASFLRRKIVLPSPKGSGRSPMVTRQV